MADSQSNRPQEADQIARAAAEGEADKAATNFDKEYEMAQQEKGGSGDQPSLASTANMGSEPDMASETSSSSSKAAGSSQQAGNPDNYKEMADSVDS
ncbi:MAG: hypothetical protein F6J97_20335 [Leptolyngbya sp. SIO4C1]|nr:hypothetical protein [Leptolyngbya sp. SIO4C1]